MSIADMEISAARPADTDTASDSAMVRRLVIVTVAAVIALSATWFGFYLDDQGHLPFTSDNSHVRIVID